MICSIRKCEEPSGRRGWCELHYTRWRRNGHPEKVQIIHGDDEARFWSYVEKTDGCWEWTGAKDGDGYGHLTIAGRVVGAHRFAYELLVGPIPEGLEIDHLCRNRACVKPADLEPVTRAENLRRAREARVM